MSAADEAFDRLIGHFPPAGFGRLIAGRSPEVARGLLADTALPVTSEGLLDALHAERIPAGRVSFYVNRLKFDLQSLGIADDRHVPAEVVDKMVGRGATLVFGHLDRSFESLHRLACLLGAALRQRIDISAVLSFTDRSGIAPHHDKENLIILQLEGEKEWVLLGNPVREGLPNDAFAGEEGAARKVTLHPGDVMFVPAGQRHLCNPSPDGSLHLGILIVAPSGASASDPLSQAIGKDPELRRPYLSLAPEAERRALLASYRERLHAMVDELDLEAILDDPRGREQSSPDFEFRKAE